MDFELVAAENSRLVELSQTLSGHLRKREVQFLATLPFLKYPARFLK